MKIKILKTFAKLNLTDNEKVFCYLATQFFKRYGFEQHFTIDHYDLKILLFGRTDKYVVEQAINPELINSIKFAFWSDKRIGFELTNQALNQCVNRYIDGKLNRKMSDEWVEITDTNAILVYTYLMGTLTHMDQWTFTSNSIVGMDLDAEIDMERDDRKTNSLQLSELLKVTRLDRRELL